MKRLTAPGDATSQSRDGEHSAIARLAQKGDRRSATAFMEAVIEAVLNRIHVVLTDNGVQFSHPRVTASVSPHGSACICSTGSAASKASSTG